MAASLALTIRSSLESDAATVWSRATDLATVSKETGSIELRFPFGYDRLDPSWIRSSDPAARGTLWAFGILPIDRWALRLERFEPGHFVERSSSIWFRTWRHERRIRETENGCEVIDRVTCEPRMPGSAMLLLPVVTRIFETRHKNLRKVFRGRHRRAPKAESTLGAGAEQETALVVASAVLAAGVAAGLTAWLLSRRR